MNEELLFETEYQEEPSDPREVLTLTVEDEEAGKRVDTFISENSALTRSAAARLIEGGAVRLEKDNKTVAKNYKLRAGDVLTLTMPEPEPCDSPCFSLELCISQLFVRSPQRAILLFCISFPWEGLDPSVLYNVTNLHPQCIRYCVYQI